jgi:sortase A
MTLSQRGDETTELAELRLDGTSSEARPDPAAPVGSRRRWRQPWPHGRPRLSAHALATAGWSLAGFTVVLLAFAVYSLVVTGWVQHRDQTKLQASLGKVIALARVGGEHRSGFFSRGGAVAPRPPAPSSAAALLSIPALHLSEAVLDGVSASHLAEGPAFYRGGAEPGGAGNVVIAGHRTLDGAPFYHLDRLKRGDPITITTTEGQFVYTVESVAVVPPAQRRVLESFGDRRLTLVTGDPVFRETHPLVVEALLTNSKDWPAAARPTSSTPSHDKLLPEVTGDQSAWWWVLLGAALALVAAMAPGLFALRNPARSDTRASWAVAAPFVLAGSFLAFHALTQVLPSTL